MKLIHVSNILDIKHGQDIVIGKDKEENKKIQVKGEEGAEA